MYTYVYAIVFLFTLIESTIYASYPYYPLALSFLGYITYKQDLSIVYFSVILGCITGLGTDSIEKNIIFFAIFTLIIYQLQKHTVFGRINLFIISIIEFIIYIFYMYFFQIREVYILNWIKLFIYLFVFNYIFYRIEKSIKK